MNNETLTSLVLALVTPLVMLTWVVVLIISLLWRPEKGEGVRRIDRLLIVFSVAMIVLLGSMFLGTFGSR